ncbi:C-terminal domain of homeodomain 1 domain containing protein [Tylopilus felleus]
MDDDLVQQLLFAETDLLDALKNGTQSLASYRESLSALPNALSTATKIGSAGDETLSLAHYVASRILVIANCYLHVKHEEEDFSAKLRIDCDAMIQQMNTLNLDAHPKSFRSDSSPDIHSPALPTALALDTGSSSSFPVSAYRWLLKNLHNPYPTAEVKARIAADSSYRVSSINSWFINARRRIGWTALCRECFSNCKADMIDAAYRALVEDPHCSLSPDLRLSFVAMKVAAEGLFPSTLTRSAFAEDLDAVVKDMTKEDRKSVGVDKSGKVNKANPIKANEDSYPSPDPSTTASSPVPALSGSFTDESEEEEDVAPPIIAGSKRPRSSIESVNELSSAASRPFKRLRASVTLQTCLPSPPSSTDGIDIPSDDSPLVLALDYIPQAETNQVSSSRKRPLSDTDAIGIPKYPSDSTAAPRLHTISDPPPRSHIENEYSLDDWFNTNFDSLFAIPPPVDATQPDFSTPWEVELFKDYSIPRSTKYAPKCPPAPTVKNAISAMTDLSDLDTLLQSICNDSFILSSNVLPSDVTGDSYAVSLDSLLPDIPQTNLDWTSLLNDAETYQPTVYSTLPQYPTDSQPLPEIDLSMLQLPHVLPTVDSQSDLVSKQAKLHQLHTMQEAVRRMEQELRSEGVVM